MKATIKGTNIEGTPKEIYALIALYNNVVCDSTSKQAKRIENEKTTVRDVKEKERARKRTYKKKPEYKKRASLQRNIEQAARVQRNTSHTISYLARKHNTTRRKIIVLLHQRRKREGTQRHYVVKK